MLSSQAKVEEVVGVAAIARFVTRGACNGYGALPIIEQSRTPGTKIHKAGSERRTVAAWDSIHPLGSLVGGAVTCAFPLLLVARGFIANRDTSASSMAMAIGIDAGKTTHQSRFRVQLPPLPNDDSEG